MLVVSEVRVLVVSEVRVLVVSEVRVLVVSEVQWWWNLGGGRGEGYLPPNFTLRKK